MNMHSLWIKRTTFQFPTSTNIIRRQWILTFMVCDMMKTSSWVYYSLTPYCVTLWAYFFAKKCSFIFMYLHYVYKMTYYIEVGHFLKKTSIVWHLRPNCHIIEYITFGYMTFSCTTKCVTSIAKCSRVHISFLGMSSTNVGRFSVVVK